MSPEPSSLECASPLTSVSPGLLGILSDRGACGLDIWNNRATTCNHFVTGTPKHPIPTIPVLHVIKFGARPKVMIREWARLGMPGDEKGKGESYEKARPGMKFQ